MSKKWKYVDTWNYGIDVDRDTAYEQLRMSYLERLNYLQCAIVGIEPEIRSDGSIHFDSDSLYTELSSDKPRELLWDFEDVLEMAMELSNKYRESL